MSVTEAIARWIAGTGYEDLPPEAMRVSKEVILDTFGVALAGATQPVGQLAIGYARGEGGIPDAGVIGGGFRTGAANAAFANGVLANALDFDATALPVGHPVCSIFPAVFALGEKLDLPGKKVIEAFVIGLEVHGKVAYGYGLQEGPARGSSVGVYGVIGAAAASAKLLGLGPWQTRMALGIAASHAGGIKKNAGTMTKPYHAGNAAAGGVRAAALACAGWTATPEPFEGTLGFADEFMGLDRFDPEITTRGLGRPFHIVDPGIAIKAYPTCHRNVRGVDAVLKLVLEHDIRPEQVEHVTVTVPNEGWMNQPHPEDGLVAKVSLQHNVAEAILHRRVGIESFDDTEVSSSEARAMTAKVELVVDPSIPSEYLDASNPVAIRLKDGRELRERVDVAHGEWGDPLSLEEIERKYTDNARRVLHRDDCDRLRDLVLKMETLDSVAEAMALATGPAVQASG